MKMKVFLVNGKAMLVNGQAVGSLVEDETSSLSPATGITGIQASYKKPKMHFCSVNCGVLPRAITAVAGSTTTESSVTKHYGEAEAVSLYSAVTATSAIGALA